MGAPQYEQAGADIGGSGTTNTIPRWTGASTLGNSGLIDDGTQLYTSSRLFSVGTSNPRGSRLSIEQTGTTSKMATFSNAVDADFEIRSKAAGILTIGPDTGTLAIQSGGTERMRVSNSGVASASQVAIGTSSFTTGRALTTVADLDVFGVRVGRGAGGVASNTAIGASALDAGTSGVQNVAVGSEALKAITSNGYATAVGARALVAATNGVNVAVGYEAGSNVTTGSSNIILGVQATTAAATDSNQCVLGSATYWVATNGGATTYYATAGALLGYMQIRLNGANVKIPVYAP